MSIDHKYSGNAYEHDNIDSRADISKAATRLACAHQVRRQKRPFNMTPEDYEAISAWATAVIGGEDSMPPRSINRFVACRWPGEPVETNGQRSEANAKRRPGRPTTIGASRRNITLDDDRAEFAARLGDGNLSEGIRRAIDIAREG